MDSPDKPLPDSIECPVTRWYYMRMVKLAGLLLFFAAWFLKDGYVGYPKESKIAEAREQYQKSVLDAHTEAKAAGSVEAWTTTAKAKGVIFGADGSPQSWAAYAARQGWPEKPKSYTPYEVAQQLQFGYAMVVGVVITGIVTLLNSKKKLIGHLDHFILSNGQRVNHAEVRKLDLSPWDLKGYATFHYQPGGTGSERKGVIDDLKFKGADVVLAQLRRNFHGQLTEAVKEEAPASGTEKKDSPEAGS